MAGLPESDPGQIWGCRADRIITDHSDDLEDEVADAILTAIST